MRASLRTLVLGTVLVGASLPFAGGQAAAGLYGVKWVETAVVPTPYCFDGSLPPGSGDAPDCESSTIYVVQEQAADGTWHYADVVGPGGASTFTIPVEYGGQCKIGYYLAGAQVSVGPFAYDDKFNANNRTHSIRRVDVDVPIGILTNDPSDVFLQLPNDLPLAGEQKLAHDEVFQGIDADTARWSSFAETYRIPLSAGIACEGSLSGNVRWGAETVGMDLHVVFLGIGQVPEPGWRAAEVEIPTEPTRPAQPSRDLSVDTQVTQAHLSVLADPTDSCRLHLSGVIVTNGSTEVQYRFVDELGVRSQIFAAQVDQTFTAMLDHHVDVEPTSPSTSPTGGLVAVSPTNDGITGLATQDTNRLQGWYQLEVLEPNVTTSDVASYNLPPCVPATSTTFDVPTQPLTTSTRSTRG